MLRSIFISTIGIFIAFSLSLGAENGSSSLTSKLQTGRYQVIMEDKVMPLILDTTTGKIWVRRTLKNGEMAWLCYDLPNEFKPEDRIKMITTQNRETSSEESAKEETGNNYSATNDPNSVFYKGNK